MRGGGFETDFLQKYFTNSVDSTEFTCQKNSITCISPLLQQSRNGWGVKCTVLRHSWSWVRTLAQAIGLSPAQTLVPPMLVDLSDGCKYMGQSGLTAMPYTRLYSVHLYWWKRQMSRQTWHSGSLHASKKKNPKNIISYQRSILFILMIKHHCRLPIINTWRLIFSGYILLSYWLWNQIFIAVNYREFCCHCIMFGAQWIHL